MQALTELILLKCKKGWFSKREAVACLGKAGAVFDGVLKRALAGGEFLRVESLDFGKLREDVKKFLKPVETSSLNLWIRELFLERAAKLFA
jgi:hypothetical protein